MPSPRDDDTQQVPWVGRAPAPRRRDLADTAEQPIIPSPLAPPPVVIVRRRWSAVVGLVLIAFAAGAVVTLLANPGLRGALGLGPQPSSSAAPTSPPSPSPSPSPPPPGIGDPVRDTAIEFVVSEVSCGHETVGEGILTRRADGQFCVVSFGLRNVGGTLAVVRAEDQYAITVEGSRHRADSDGTAAANGVFLVVPLLVTPGQSIVGDVVFDIPEGAALASLELHDGENSEGVVVVAPQPT